MESDPSQKEVYKQIFDIIRPRSEYPEWLVWTLVGFTLVLIALLWGGRVVVKRRDERRLWQTFRELAEEKGLTEEEGDLLRDMALEAPIPNVLLIFSSVTAFDGGVDQRLERYADPGDPRTREVTTRLQSIRQKLQFDRKPLGWALRHTREIPVGQRLLVGFKREDETRFCSCVAVEVETVGITVTPIVREDEEALKDVTPEDILYVRFWRQGDTEYKFRTRLLPETDPERATLLLAHTDKLGRVQRRDYFRLRVQIPIVLFPLPNPETAEMQPSEIRIDEEATPRLQADLIDLSAGGAAILTSESCAQDELLLIDPMFRSTFAIAGVVCRVVRSEQPEKGEYIHHLEFLNVDDDLRERLVHQLQRRQMRLAKR